VIKGQQNIKYIKISQNLAEHLKTMPEIFKLCLHFSNTVCLKGIIVFIMLTMIIIIQ